jgi:SAM-dependent methyltransferase
MSDLWHGFLTHRGRVADKWTHYFPAYERHFRRYVNLPVVFLEVGVQRGGSLQLWKQYLGPYAQVVGIDIDPRASFDEHQIAVRIGNQSDTSFLQSVIDEFGQPDVVLDDGSHMMSDVTETFRYLYSRMSPSGVYMVEDMHTAYWSDWGGGLHASTSFIEIAKSLIDELNADTSNGAVEPTAFTAETLSIHFYESLVVFERGRHAPRHSLSMGTMGFPVPPALP